MVTGISMQGVTKSFKSAHSIVTPLKDLSLTIEPGKLTTVLGKSGCGKTTLLKTVFGLEKPEDGRVSFFLENGEPNLNPNMSLVFQDPRLLPWKTVEENLSLAVRTLPKEKQQERIEEVLDLVQLIHTRSLYPAQLSGGMAQRVGLARGLISKPDLLLLDEPFGALDFMTRSQLQIDFSRIQTELETTILLITHDINEAVLLSDRILFMKDGCITNDLSIDLAKPRKFGDENLLVYQKQLFNFFYD